MENKPGQGAIFKNDAKKSEKEPDYKGTVNVDGAEKQIALWLRTTKDGSKKYFSVQVSEPYKKQDTNYVVKPITDEINEDTLPF